MSKRQRVDEINTKHGRLLDLIQGYSGVTRVLTEFLTPSEIFALSKASRFHISRLKCIVKQWQQFLTQIFQSMGRSESEAISDRIAFNKALVDSGGFVSGSQILAFLVGLNKAWQGSDLDIFVPAFEGEPSTKKPTPLETLLETHPSMDTLHVDHGVTRENIYLVETVTDKNNKDRLWIRNYRVKKGLKIQLVYVQKRPGETLHQQICCHFDLQFLMNSWDGKTLRIEHTDAIVSRQSLDQRRLPIVPQTLDVWIPSTLEDLQMEVRARKYQAREFNVPSFTRNGSRICVEPHLARLGRISFDKYHVLLTVCAALRNNHQTKLVNRSGEEVRCDLRESAQDGYGKLVWDLVL